MEDSAGKWVRMRFKGNKVWVAVGPEGRPIVKNGLATVKYRLEHDKAYNARATGLSPIPGEESPVDAPAATATPSAKPGKKAEAVACRDKPGADVPENAIVAYTDGACSGNPGPAGIGVVLRQGGHEKEISEYIGEGTNNIAELTAILKALETIRNKDLPVRLFTDSSYALGLICKGWKPRKNQELVARILRLAGRFRDLEIIKIKGHAGAEGNERADALAVAAVQRGR